MRGDGSLGQVENISVGWPADGETARSEPAYGTTFTGKVHYYGGEGNAEFQVVFSGTDADGNLHVFGQDALTDFTGGEHHYSFTYADPNA